MAFNGAIDAVEIDLRVMNGTEDSKGQIHSHCLKRPQDQDLIKI